MPRTAPLSARLCNEIEQDEEQREEQKKSCCEHRLNRQWIVGDVAVGEPFHMSGCGGGRQRQADNQTSGKQHRVHDLQSDTSEVIRPLYDIRASRVIGAHRIAFIPETAKKAGVRSRKRERTAMSGKTFVLMANAAVAKMDFRFATFAARTKLNCSDEIRGQSP